MPLLDACLAFALTMLSLATIATLTTEMFVRLMGTRANGLRLMLDDLFQQELLPALKGMANEATLKQLKEQCSTVLLKSPLADLPSNTRWNSILKFTAGWLGMTKLTSLKFEDFLKRLPETELGKKVAALAEENRKKLFDRLAHRYEEFGDAVTDLFTRYSQLFSLIVGVGVAFAMNVDSFRLFSAYQEDAALRGRVVATADQVFSDWEKAQKQVDERLNAAGGKAPDLTKEQLDARKQEIIAQWKQANSLDLPIGYDHFQRMAPVKEPKYIPFTRIDCASVRFYGCWALRVIISGLLIGLGGPFWYNIATKLMEVTKSFRSGAAAEGAAARTRGLRNPYDDEDNPADDLFMKFAHKT